MDANGRRRPQMSVEEFRLLAELFYSHCGVVFREDMRYLMERRLGARLSAVGLSDFTAYHRLLRFGPSRDVELEAAVDAVLTHETYFFRDENQLRAFREELLPQLAETRPDKRLCIWSAGCSTGEEPYTLAMLVRDSGLFAGWTVEIFGSDISTRVLALAREGIYSAAAFRQTPPEMLSRWFRPQGDRFAVRDELRAMVTFAQVNLLDGALPGAVGRVDVIFCRNVMIYFDLPARKRVLTNLHARLDDGGFLLLGHSESLVNVTADFELVHLKNDLVYRKPAPAR